MNTFITQKFKFSAFICIIFLVFIHGYNLNSFDAMPYAVIAEPLTFTAFFEYFFANGILRFCIPMLFIMAGYLYASKDDLPQPERVKKRLHTLLIPYLTWSAIGLLLTWLLQQYELAREAVLAALTHKEYKTVDQYTLGNFLWKWLIYPLPFQLWIIRCIFIYMLMYPLLRTALNFRAITFSILIFLWLISFDAVFIEGEGFLFFTLGIWLYKTRFNIETVPPQLKIKALFVAWLILAGLKTWLAFNKQVVDTDDPNILLILLHKATVALGLVVAWYAFNAVIKVFAERKWFKWAVTFTFIIYVLHAPLITYATNLVLMYIPGTYSRLLTFILLPAIIILFCIFFGFILKKGAPKVYGFLTGGRLD